MPSMLHEGLILLFRNCPTLVVELLRAVGRAIPRFATVRVVDADFSQLVPTAYRADLVIELVDRKGRVVLGTVLESQLRARRQKKWV